MSVCVFRWEAELSASFELNVDPSLWSRQSAGVWLQAQESTCSDGRADSVWGYFGPGLCPADLQQHASVLQNPIASKIIALVRKGPAQTEEDLAQRLGVSRTSLRKHIRDLKDSGLLMETRNGRLKMNFKIPLYSAEICSFELKLKNWKRALYQATRYRSFSHRAFVVMPSDSIAPAVKNLESFKKANIGLIAHDCNGTSEVIFRPKKRRPHATYRTIMAVGMLSETLTKDQLVL